MMTSLERDKTMRICFVDYALEPDKPGRSGLSDIVWDMATALVEQGHAADVVASYHTDRYPDSRVTVHNFPTPPIGYRNIVGQLWILKRAAAIVRRIGPDIVHTPEYVSTAVLASLGIQAPLIVTPPGNIYKRLATNTNTFDWQFTPVLKWAASVSARRCARVIAISSDMKYWWEQTGSAPERTPWIPLGVDQRRFHPIADARERLGIDPRKLFLLYVGRFSAEKGLLDLLDALQLARDTLTPADVQVTLVGHGPEEQALRHGIAAAGLDEVVRIRPWVAQDELSTWYSAADALLLPSRSEAFGRAMAEAMACGTPVIASTEGPKDYISDMRNGMLFPPGDATSLAAILAAVARDPARLRGIRPDTFRYVQEHLTWERVVRRIIEEVYAPLIEPSHVRRSSQQPMNSTATQETRV
jgi:glycosyltransferase involved in cell wall biosynthesis